MTNRLAVFWSLPAAAVCQELQTSPQGLTSAEAEQRLARYGLNRIKAKSRADALTLFVAQFKSPIIVILLLAAGLSLFLSDAADAFIIIAIVMVSGLLGFWQEKGATDAVQKLLAIVQVRAAVLRDGKELEISVEEVVPGDVVILNAGDVIPGDCVILESKDLFVNEATLTGETYPSEKQPGMHPAAAALSQRTNSLFMGTHVVSGTAKAIIVCTAGDTEFGKVSASLRLPALASLPSAGSQNGALRARIPFREVFRTGWFMESVVSASLIVLIIRTRQPFFKSTPGTSLWIATLLVVLGTLILPYTQLSWFFGFTPMPLEFLPALAGILFLYIATAEVAKKVFYQRVQF